MYALQAPPTKIRLNQECRRASLSVQLGVTLEKNALLNKNLLFLIAYIRMVFYVKPTVAKSVTVIHTLMDFLGT